MAEDEQDEALPPPRGRHPARVALGMLFGIAVSLALSAAVGLYLGLWLGGRALVLPDSASRHVERIVNARMTKGHVEVGSLGLSVGEDGVPRLVLFDLGVVDASGGVAASAAEVEARLSLPALAERRFGVTDVALTGTEATLRRATDGSFSIDFGAGARNQSASLAVIFEGLERSLSRPGLAEIETIRVSALTAIVEDARSGRVWQATNARALIRQEEDALSMTVATDVFNGTDNVAQVQFSGRIDRQTRIASLQANIEGVPASDAALQTPALAWLGVLDAPISGAVRATFRGDGSFGGLAGTLDIGPGAVRPNEESRPVGFDRAEVYFDVDPDAGRIDFQSVDVAGEVGHLLGVGSVDLAEFSGGWPGAYIGQFRVAEALYSGDGQLQEPLALTGGAADFRLRLAPFSLEIGQAFAATEDGTVHATARIGADAGGWDVSVDAGAGRVPVETVLASWPLALTPGTRGWLRNHLSAGTMTDVSVAVRSDDGARPQVGLSFGFEDATLSYLPDLPPVTDASGRAEMIHNAFIVRVDEGQVALDEGRVVDGAGTVFRIDDLSERPAVATLELAAEGPLDATLALLDRRPFRVMERAGRSSDIAEGHAVVAAEVRFPLKGGMQPSDVDYAVRAVAHDVQSDVLVPGRRLQAAALEVRATPDEVTVTGPAELSGVPIEARWRQPIGVNAGPGDLAGDVSVSPETLAAFGVDLPRGMVSGQGRADWRLDFGGDSAPELTVTSDLAGLRLALDAAGWSKPAGAGGDFEARITLGETPRVERLTLAAPGLTASGRIEVAPDGGLAAAVFDRVTVGGWLDTGVRITPGADPSRPSIRLSGGRLDLRSSSFGEGGGGGGGGAITFDLDRLVLTDGIALAPISGRVTSRGGLSGRFTGKINGEAPVEGELMPYRGRTAIRLSSPDAGRAVRASGLMKNTYGGTLNLTLVPSGQAAYDGAFDIADIRLRKAPVMADLLDAISVVGLIDQLEGPGILFGSVDGRFRLDRDSLTVSQAAAVGGSLGVSLDGSYDLKAGALDMQGVISPVYFLNGIGQVFTRRGEGLFGFAYRLTGPANAPRIAVNPLSILTPGMFREIFRKPPPEG